ncbi:AmmeMemoRadiSam system protein A [Thermosipho ferrireducens]|uniref:AmmeMemoRadiSam system protein A n=1 Tax=Thermosipho ferrireducens TaxID=2571116 RepID=A0ABX7SBS0_9BACT|nr:AmmeMemoRadiSam system protein A [Thermosipho ferrireducens]QTA38880.1 AmmeMemoRadiSam system protein A [Thermosipho ferrireducens]
MRGEHPYVRWAIEVIETYIKTKKILDPDPDRLPKELFEKKAGCFVTLHTFNGALRGCIGTYEATQENLALEIRNNAIASATRDPRFPPVTEDELGTIKVNVDVLSEIEPVKQIDELDPKKFGIIVAKGWQRGLLLPDIEGVNTVEEQIRIAKLKAGIFDENYTLYKFTVERYE